MLGKEYGLGSNTEELSVTAAQEAFAWCERLVPNLATQDKVINQDGEIQIYQSGSRHKSTHLGNTKAQVKGVRWPKPFPETSTHSAKVLDLHGYLNEGGLILIQGLVNQKSRTVELYYIVLNPFKILDFIKRAGDNKTTTLRLAKLPTDSDALTSIVLYSHAAQREDPSNYGKSFRVHEGHTLQIVTSTHLPYNLPVTLDRSRGEIDFSIFSVDSDGIRTPIDGAFDLLPHDYVEHPVELNIGSASTVYDQITGKRLSDGTLRLTLSSGLHMLLSRPNEVVNVSITVNTEGSVADFAKDSKFYTECLTDSAVWINDKRMDFEAGHADSAIHEQCAAVADVVALFDQLGVDGTKVRMSDLSESVVRELNTFRRAIIDSEELKPRAPGSGRYAIEIGADRIEILLELSETTKRWTAHNPYGPDFARLYYHIEGEGTESRTVRPVTPYDILTVDDIVRTLNLNLANAVESYSRLPKSSRAGDLANQFVLNLLLASDASPIRRYEFLDAAQELLNWMEAENPSDDPIRFVNAMQTISRKGALDEGQLKELRRLRREMDRKPDSVSTEIAFCCSVLLLDLEDACDRLEEMDVEQSERIREWPICALMKR